MLTWLRGIDTKGLTASPKLLRLFALYEALTRFVNPWSTAVVDRPHNTTPITQGCNIIDITGVGLKQFWDLKSHLQDSSALAQAHYPETLDRIFVSSVVLLHLPGASFIVRREYNTAPHQGTMLNKPQIIGAPSWFPTIWNWVKKFFDPIVVSKMFVIAPSEVLSTLAEHIEKKNIPKQYGGDLDYTFGDMPVLDDSMVEALGAKWGSSGQISNGTSNGQAGPGIGSSDEQPTSLGSGKTRSLPIGPIKWEEGPDGRMRAVAVGTVKGKRRSEVVLTLERMYGEVFYPQHRPAGCSDEGKSSGETTVNGASSAGSELPRSTTSDSIPAPEPPSAPTTAGPAATTAKA